MSHIDKDPNWALQSTREQLQRAEEVRAQERRADVRETSVRAERFRAALSREEQTKQAVAQANQGQAQKAETNRGEARRLETAREAGRDAVRAAGVRGEGLAGETSKKELGRGELARGELVRGETARAETAKSSSTPLGSSSSSERATAFQSALAGKEREMRDRFASVTASAGQLARADGGAPGASPGSAGAPQGSRDKDKAGSAAAEKAGLTLETSALLESLVEGGMGAGGTGALLGKKGKGNLGDSAGGGAGDDAGGAQATSGGAAQETKEAKAAKEAKGKSPGEEAISEVAAAISAAAQLGQTPAWSRPEGPTQAAPRPRELPQPAPGSDPIHQLLIGKGPDGAEAKMMITVGPLAGTTINLREGPGGLVAQILTQNESARQTLNSAMAAVANRLKEKGHKLDVRFHNAPASPRDQGQHPGTGRPQR